MLWQYVTKDEAISNLLLTFSPFLHTSEKQEDRQTEKTWDGRKKQQGWNRWEKSLKWEICVKM